MRLNLDLEEDKGIEWIKFTLTASQNTSVEHRQECSTNTPNRIYHRREALVIGMRQLVGKALEAGLISISPGTLIQPKSSTNTEHNTERNEPILSETDWGLGSEFSLI